jgi:hypothetical protein
VWQLETESFKLCKNPAVSQQAAESVIELALYAWVCVAKNRTLDDARTQSRYDLQIRSSGRQ